MLSDMEPCRRQAVFMGLLDTWSWVMGRARYRFSFVNYYDVV